MLERHSDQTHSCPRDWRCSASWVPNFWGHPWNPSGHYSTFVLRRLRWPLTKPSLCREMLASRTADVFFSSLRPIRKFIFVLFSWEIKKNKKILFDAHREIFFESVESTRNQIVFSIFPLIWNYQSDPNQSENGKHNMISGWFNKIRKRYLCVWVPLMWNPVEFYFASGDLKIYFFYSPKLIFHRENLFLFFYSEMFVWCTLVK